MAFVLAAEDCKQLIKLPKVKCLRNHERQGRPSHGAERCVGCGGGGYVSGGSRKY